MLTVPVRLGERFEGLAHCEGLLKLSSEALVLQFQTTDTILGVLKSKVQRFEMAFEELEYISYRKTITGAVLELRLSDMELLSQVANAQDGLIRLKVTRRNRMDAKEVQAICSLAIADSRLELIEEVLEKRGE